MGQRPISKVEMRKTELLITSILLLTSLAYGQEAPEGGINKEYYESGQLKYELIPKDGEGAGIAKGYYESGQLKYEVIFKDLNNGTYKEYYKNGLLKLEEDFNGYNDFKDIQHEGIIGESALS